MHRTFQIYLDSCTRYRSVGNAPKKTSPESINHQAPLLRAGDIRRTRKKKQTRFNRRPSSKSGEVEAFNRRKRKWSHTMRSFKLNRKEKSHPPPPASAMWQRPPSHWLCLLQEQCEVSRRPSSYRVKPYSSASSAPRSMAFFFQNRTCSSN